MAALEVQRGQVIQRQRAIAQVLSGQRRFEAFLACHQPVHGLVEVVLAAALQAQTDAQTGGGGLDVQASRRGQLRLRPQNAGHHHRTDQLALRARPRRQQPIQLQPAEGAQHRRDVAVRQRAGDLEQRLGRHQRLALEHPPQGLDLRPRQVGEIGQGAALDLASFPVAFAQQEGRRRGPIGHFGDIHAYKLTPHLTKRKREMGHSHLFTCLHKDEQNTP